MTGYLTPRPTRLVGGGPRRFLQSARLLLALSPVLALVAVAVVVIVNGGVLAAAGLVLCLVPFRRPLRRLLARVYWRARWKWDARAAALARMAEVDIDTVEDGGRQVEVFPSLIRVQLTGAGRSYLLRPLPGQTRQDFEAACPALAVRWRATVVQVEPVPGRLGRGRLLLSVVTGATVDRAEAMPRELLAS